MIGRDLYRRGYSTPLLKCITTEQVEYVLKEIHDGACGNHSRARTMATKVLRAVYYWPTVQGDCANYVKKCIKCQEFSPLHHLKPEELHNITSVIRCVGDGHHQSLLPRQRPNQTPVCRNRLLHKVDRGRTSRINIDHKRPKLCMEEHRVSVWSVAHHHIRQWTTVHRPRTTILLRRSQHQIHNKLGPTPQTNDQTEAANKVILNELKKRLGATKGRWTEELLEVLWAYRCTPQTSTQETPYNLTYDSEVRIPVEIGEPTI